MKNKTKKLLLIITIISAMTFSLVACSAEEEEDTTVDTEVSEETDEEEEEETEEEEEEEEEEETDEDTESEEDSDTEDIIDSDVISIDESYADSLNEMDIDLVYYSDTQSFIGTITNSSGTDLTNITITIELSDDSTSETLEVIEIESLANGDAYDVDLDATSDTEYLYWQIFTTAEKDETTALDLSEAYEVEADGISTSISYDSDTGLFEGTMTNTSDADIYDVSLSITLDNESILTLDDYIDILIDESYEISIDASSETDFTTYEVTVEIVEAS